MKLDSIHYEMELDSIREFADFTPEYAESAKIGSMELLSYMQYVIIANSKLEHKPNAKIIFTLPDHIQKVIGEFQKTTEESIRRKIRTTLGVS